MPLARLSVAARLYDRVTAPLERRALARWRRLTWSRVPRGGRGLEVGAGTGANFSYHPSDGWLVATDLSPRMLDIARGKPRSSPTAAVPSSNYLVASDVQALPFRAAAFDWVVGTLVFCEVDRPVEGLAEIGRVLKPGGALILLEHVRPSGWLGRVADAATTISGPFVGEHFDRDTVGEVKRAGFLVREVGHLWRDGVVLLTASAPA